TCSCSAVETLLSYGYFPCAPKLPTLAFSTSVLDIAREMALRSSPNVTAWSGAWAAILKQQGLSRCSEDDLRKRLAEAIHWYTYLKD
ncbi:hypothetical protein FISHEDRAFT_13318, partial [Fistulina hepatica ATCC 64428]